MMNSEAWCRGPNGEMQDVGELARKVEMNLSVVTARRAQAAGSEIHGEVGLRWTFAPRALWLPGCDRTLLPPTGEPEKADEWLEEAVMFYAPRQAAVWCTTTAQRTPAGWHAALKSFGWQYQFSGTCMAADLRQLEGVTENSATQRTIEIRELESTEREQHRNWVVAEKPIEHPYFGSLQAENAANEFLATLRMAERGQARIFHAYGDDAWQGSALLCLAARVAGIYDVGVRPEARRRGIASALVRHICQVAWEAGYEYATLQNGHGLIQFYERLGFRVISSLQHWQRSAEERNLTQEERENLRAQADFLLLETFLHHVFCGERGAALALLRERPAIARLQQRNGGTALHVASFHGESELARALLAAGAKTEVREQDFGATPLIHAVIGAGPWGPQFKTGQVDVIRSLLAAGADPQATNAWGEAAAQLAPRTLPKDLRVALGVEER